MILLRTIQFIVLASAMGSGLEAKAAVGNGVFHFSGKGILVGRAVSDTLVISGVVTEARTGRPLAGVNVVYGDAAVLTDDKGHFALGVPDLQVSIAVRGAGFQQKEVALKGRSVVGVVLYEEGFSSFYEDAVFPVGSRALNKTVGAVGTVHMQGSWQANAETPDSYLQGRVPGLTVTRRSGTPGIGAELLLRGYSSLYGTNQPLLVVDGVMFDNNHYGSSLIGGHLTNPLQDIDVKDIDNITVEKDAVTTYGTKAANGVIYITTNRVKDLATHIDFAAYEGVNVVPKKLPLLSAGDYRIYLSDLLKSGGYSDEQIKALPYMNDDRSASGFYSYHNNTDWQDVALRAGRESNYYLKVTGGDDIARYALSMGYGKNNSITDQTSLTNYRTRFNADLNLTKKLTARANLAFSYNEQALKDQGMSVKTNPLFVGLVKAPFLAVNDVNDEGLKSPNLAETDVFNVSNPQALISNAQEADKNYRFSGGLTARYVFDDHFNLGATVGLTYDKVRENTFIPRKGVADDTLMNAVADSRLGSRVQRLFVVNTDVGLSYAAVVNHFHRFNARVGFRYNQTNSEEDYTLGYNSATDNLISVGTGTSALRVVGGDIGKSKWLNGYAGLDYDLYGKYFLTAGVSADGSSRFGRAIGGVLSVGGNSLAVLPSVGVGWLVSSEGFMAGVKWVELLKLRASYGLVGNDDIGNYAARRVYTSQNLLGLEGLVRENVGNPALQWERVEKVNVGLDAAFLKERLRLSVDVFRNRTSRMLTYEPVAAASGVDVVVTNGGGLETKGLDVRVNGRVLNGGVTWDVGVVISKFSSRVSQLADGLAFNTTYADATFRTEVGSAPNVFYGFRTRGVYATDAAAAADGYVVKSANGSLLPFKGGDVRFTDRNGDGVIDDNDRFAIGDPNPDYTGGFSSSVGYKRWSLDVLFSFSKGNDVYNYTRAVLESGSTTYNQTQRLVNRWRADGQVTDVPRVSLGDPMGNARFSDRWIEDGSYLRLRTVGLSYDLPVRGKLLRYAKVYVTGNNLLTWTHYLGYDPEFSANSSPFGQGVDTGLEPIYKSVQVGLRVGL